MILNDRLNKIKSLISSNSIIADIGTDHGLIPASLIIEKKAKFAILTDISGNSLNKARLLFKENNISSSADFRVGDGLKVLKPFEVDEIIISGMGGLLIEEILKAGMTVAKNCHSLVLGANNACPELREFLFNNGFGIYNELLSEDRGKFYEIFYVKFGVQPLKYDYSFISPYWVKDEIYKRYMDYRIKRYETALNGMKAAKEPDLSEIEKISKKIEILKNSLIKS